MAKSACFLCPSKWYPSYESFPGSKARKTVYSSADIEVTRSMSLAELIEDEIRNTSALDFAFLYHEPQ